MVWRLQTLININVDSQDQDQKDGKELFFLMFLIFKFVSLIMCLVAPTNKDKIMNVLPFLCHSNVAIY